MRGGRRAHSIFCQPKATAAAVCGWQRARGCMQESFSAARSQGWTHPWCEKAGGGRRAHLSSERVDENKARRNFWPGEAAGMSSPCRAAKPVHAPWFRDQHQQSSNTFLAGAAFVLFRGRVLRKRGARFLAVLFSARRVSLPPSIVHPGDGARPGGNTTQQGTAQHGTARAQHVAAPPQGAQCAAPMRSAHTCKPPHRHRQQCSFPCREMAPTHQHNRVISR